MKKLIAILLGVVLMASMLAVFTVSAESWSKNGEVYHVIRNGEDLKTVFENIYYGSSGKWHILLASTEICTSPITVSEDIKDIYFIIEPYKEEGIQSCTITCTNNNAPIFNLAASSITMDFSSSVTLKSRNESGDGGVIYVDGENCTIDGGWYVDSYAKVDGGAICVNRDNCTIKNCHFKNCRAGDDGGAIYFCSGADEGAVWNCTFEGCSSDDEGNFVNGDGDTVINLCTYGDDDDDYYHCEIQSFAGSVLSDGSLWIIVAVAVVVIAALVVLVVFKKKKVTATAGNASDSDDE